MKFISPTSTYIAVAAAAAIHSTSVSAFAPQHQHLSCTVSSCTVPNQALHVHAMIPEHEHEHEHENENENNAHEVTIPSRRKAFTVAGGVVGWILGPRLANAAGAYVPESGFDSLDFSMPSYSVDKNAAPPKGNAYGNGEAGSGASISSDPAKEAERLELIERAQMKKKEKEDMELNKAKAYFDNIKAKEEKDAEKARIKAEVEAGRAAMKDAKLKSKIPASE
uniref:Uncharacterized protein n=1 Tax=Chaetoceros debilis TaxID=122233 RepID=A0A7S3Q6U2_9STRA|eukprot:CAMPEP_0194118408 /NCGR_PEP_ID=MMETSP0150-20130528/35343_1 /TAXON_ID=122233 /ORGANISM="Chaetoceros debilis, Strain MM31A-1" /LENGTH=222 /DNA_ID=CAMNT_0038809767 /DNA_START=35 /DNA_END=703 /DNA_ORIENTATION=-